MKSSKSGFLKILGFILMGLVIFTFSLWLHFPYGSLSKKIESELFASGIDIEITGLGAGDFPGFKADSVLIKSVRGEPLSLKLSPVKIGLDITSTVKGNPVVNISTAALGGRIDSRVDIKDKKSETLFKEISLGSISKAISSRVPPLEGAANGRLTLSGDPQDPGKINGTVIADLKGSAVGPGKISVAAVPRIDLGSGRLSATMEGNNLLLEAFNLSGGDVELSADGTATIMPRLMRSNIDLNFSLTPEKNIEMKLPLVFGMLSQAKLPDGSYQGKIKGPLQAARLRTR